MKAILKIIIYQKKKSQKIKIQKNTKMIPIVI